MDGRRGSLSRDLPGNFFPQLCSAGIRRVAPDGPELCSLLEGGRRVAAVGLVTAGGGGRSHAISARIDARNYQDERHAASLFLRPFC